jgi:hypothetical protein
MLPCAPGRWSRVSRPYRVSSSRWILVPPQLRRVHAQICVCGCARVRACACACVRVCLCAHVRACMYARVCRARSRGCVSGRRQVVLTDNSEGVRPPATSAQDLPGHPHRSDRAGQGHAGLVVAAAYSGRSKAQSANHRTHACAFRPSSAPRLGSPLPHLHRAWAQRCHIGTETGLTPAISAPGLGLPLPHLHRAWAQRYHVCTETGLTPATSAPGLGSPLPHLHRDWAHRCHICTETGLSAATSAPGLGSPLPHLHRDWAHRCHICTGTGLTAATSAPGLRRRRARSA